MGKEKQEQQEPTTGIPRLEKEKRKLVRRIDEYSDSVRGLIDQIRKWKERVEEIDKQLAEIGEGKSLGENKGEDIHSETPDSDGASGDAVGDDEDS